MKSIQFSARSRRNSGITLIEVAVSVFVLSIGILGLSSLQLSAKRAGFEAVQRTAASAMAYDVIERMRNNAASLTSYDGQEVGAGSISTAPTPNCMSANVCTAAQLAARDLWEWEQALDGTAEQRSGASVGGLNNARGCIDTDVGGVAGIIRVTIAWDGYSELSTTDTTNTCGDELSTRRQLLVVDSFISAG